MPVGFHWGDFVFEVFLDVESEVAIWHYVDVEGVFALLLLSVGHFEGFGEFVKTEVFVVNDADRGGIAHYEMPALHLQEGICDSTAEIAESVGFDSDNNLEEVACSDNGLVFDFKFALNFDNREVLQTLFDVGRPVGVKQVEEVLSFFFFLLKGLKIGNLFTLLFFEHFIDFFIGEIQLHERFWKFITFSLDEILLEENEALDARLAYKIVLGFGVLSGSLAGSIDAALDDYRSLFHN